MFSGRGSLDALYSQADRPSGAPLVASRASSQSVATAFVGDNSCDRGVDSTCAPSLVLAHEVAHRRRLRDAVADMLGEAIAPIVAESLGHDGLVEAVCGRCHPWSGACVELDYASPAVLLRPGFNLGAPSPRVARQFAEVELGEGVVDGGLNLEPWDSPAWVVWVLPQAGYERVAQTASVQGDSQSR